MNYFSRLVLFVLLVLCVGGNAYAQGRPEQEWECARKMRQMAERGFICGLISVPQNTPWGFSRDTCRLTCKPGPSAASQQQIVWMPPQQSVYVPVQRAPYDQSLVDTRQADDAAWDAKEREAEALRAQLAAQAAQVERLTRATSKAPTHVPTTSSLPPVPVADALEARRQYQEMCAAHANDPVTVGDDRPYLCARLDEIARRGGK